MVSAGTAIAIPRGKPLKPRDSSSPQTLRCATWSQSDPSRTDKVSTNHIDSQPSAMTTGLRQIYTVGRPVLLLLVMLSACVAPDHADPGAILQLDEAGFRCTVEPILIRDCS